MELSNYIKSTSDTWQSNPIDLYSKEEYNLRLQKIKGLIGCIGEFYELRDAFVSESLLEYRDNTVDELGDVLYYLCVTYKLFFSAEQLEEQMLFTEQLLHQLGLMTIISWSETQYYKIQTMTMSGKFFSNINKPIFRKNKDFDLEFISNLLNELLTYIYLIARNVDIDINYVMQKNHDKLHNLENADKRGLEINNGSNKP